MVLELNLESSAAFEASSIGRGILSPEDSRRPTPNSPIQGAFGWILHQSVAYNNLTSKRYWQEKRFPLELVLLAQFLVGPFEGGSSL
jgi:hypothetical protein